MKVNAISCCLLLIVCCSVKAQIFKTSFGEKNTPTYFVDSVECKQLPIFDAMKIERINVSKDTGKTGRFKNGRIDIFLKKSKNIYLMSLPQIAVDKGIKDKNLLFMIDNEFVEDYSNIQIDSAYVLRCAVIPSTDFKYLTRTKAFTIINILTKSKANLEKEKPRVYVRGKADL